MQQGFFSHLERLTEGVIWWVILAVVFLMNFDYITVANPTAIYVLAIIVGAFNFLWHRVLPGRVFIAGRSYWEVIVQLIFAAGLVNLTGGIQSLFYFVYFIPLITVTVVLSEPLVTAEVLALTVLLTVGEALWQMNLSDLALVLTPTVLKVFALVTVGIFASELGKLLARERKEREEKGNELISRAHQMAAIHQVASHINSSMDIQDTFRLMAQEARKIASFDRISIAVPAEGGKKLEIFAALGLGEDILGPGSSCPLKGSVLERVMERGQPVIIEDLSQEGDPTVTNKMLLEKGVKCHVAFPLICQGQVLGSLNFFSCQPGLGSQVNLEVLRPMAEQVAMAMANYRLFEMVKQESVTDGLTGLHNHRYFQERLDIEIKRCLRTNRPLALLMADLDNFKLFNDLNGHLLGDEALKSAAALMKSCLRTEDLVARYGGEEFVILLTETDGPGAMIVAERLRQKIDKFEFQTKPGVVTPLTISIGVAIFPKDAHAKEWLVKRADQALYLAKKKGRNHVWLFNPEALSVEELSAEELIKEELSLGIIQALAHAVDAKDAYTYRHSESVAKFASILAKEVGLSNEEVAEMRTAGLVHDVGKIGVSDEILKKNGQLSPEEWKMIKEHPRMGCNILKHVPSLAPILPAVLHHHERYDGHGYPAGLKGEEIPLAARILALADAYHAVICERPYRRALSSEEALAEFNKEVGKQFDPHLVKAFLNIIETSPEKLA